MPKHMLNWVHLSNPKILLLSMMQLFRLLPAAQKQEFLQRVAEAA